MIIDIVRSNFKIIIFGFVFTFFSSIGQSFFIGLFNSDIREELNITNAEFGSIYGILGQDLNIYENTSMKENMTYSIIKGGIINFTRQMASYYGKHVRINSISPGGLRGHVQGKSKNQEKKFIINYSNKVPINRLGNSIEIAYSTLFLASDAASYINGHNLIVDGGWSII